MKAFLFVKKGSWIFSIVLLGALLLAACLPAPMADTPMPTVNIPVTGNASPAPAVPAYNMPSATPAANITAMPAASEAELNVVMDPKLGNILAGNKGMTLYAFTKDTPDTSTCSGGCLKAWPALLTQGSPLLGAGVDKTLVGSAALADGSKIVTYNHMPLYYWSKDAKAGDTTGQGVGNVWYVVTPDGKLVKDSGTAAPATGLTQAAPASGEAQINVVMDPKLGNILVGNNGMTVYMYTVDPPDQSTCTGGCLKAWPALLTQGNPVLGAGVNKALVGTASLADGSKIVTYNHMALYYWMKDKKPGDTTGQGVGKVWYVVSPDGKIVGQ